MKELREIGEAGDTPAPDPRAALVERIASSRHFARSPRLRAFLLYTAERTLGGRAGEITEHRIAAEVFERTRRFDPSEDNIVRVAVRQLRTKLRDYYELEGRDEEWLVGIPKGGYVPVFQRRAPEAAPAGPPAVRSGYWIPVLAILLALATGVAAILWFQNRALRAAASQPRPAEDVVSASIVQPHRRIWIVPTDSGLSLAELLMGRNVPLDEYTAPRKPPPPPELRTDRGRLLWQALGARHLTHTALFTLAQRLMRHNPGTDILVRHPRTLSARDFKQDNFLLLGMTNPWNALFEEKLNFPLEVGYPSGQSRIRNRAPQPGEPSVFEEARRNQNHSYARVALIPNLTGTGRVMLISGLGTYKTEAAGEFLLKPGSAALVRKALSAASGQLLPDFEMVLESTEVDATGTTARILTCRAHAKER